MFAVARSRFVFAWPLRYDAGHSPEERTVIDSCLARIRLIITDVDGVLTDGSLYYGEGGEVIKRFHVRDGLGVRLLQQADIEFAVISGRDSAALRRRLGDLGVRLLRLSVADKGAATRELLEETGIGAEEAIFVGDDIIDVAGFKACGCSAAVADAPSYVREQATLVLATNGGDGALRELADRILMAQGKGHLLYQSGNFQPADGGTRQ
jgi:3-deoxy-manno-octulosonate cytidylyltransferase (CMP-KDO synthetase)